MQGVIMIICVFLPSALLITFFALGKTYSQDESLMRSFECGYSSYFYSRFSFSVQYFVIGMIFLFLDLELCMVLPLFCDDMLSPVIILNAGIMVLILLAGLLMEWLTGKMEWVK